MGVDSSKRTQAQLTPNSRTIRTCFCVKRVFKSCKAAIDGGFDRIGHHILSALWEESYRNVLDVSRGLQEWLRVSNISRKIVQGEIETQGRLRLGWHQRVDETPPRQYTQPYGLHFIIDYLVQSKTPVAPQSTYSYDVAPRDFFAWRNSRVTKFVKGIPAEDFKSVFQASQIRLQNCIGMGREYFKEF